MAARDRHRWREPMHQEVRRADGTTTPLHRWVRRYRRPFDLTSPYGSAWKRIQPFSTGGNYLNFQPAEDDATRTAALWGNYQRLQQVKPSMTRTTCSA